MADDRSVEGNDHILHMAVSVAREAVQAGDATDEMQAALGFAFLIGVEFGLRFGQARPRSIGSLLQFLVDHYTDTTMQAKERGKTMLGDVEQIAGPLPN